MELKLKNPMLKSNIDGFINMDGSIFGVLNNKSKGCSLESLSFSIPIGYFTSLCDSVEICENAFDNHPTLDLTYQTLEHLPFILAMQYGDYALNNDMNKENALQITKKTLATYLMLLCMNEHMCFPTIYMLENVKEIMDTSSALGKNPDDSWMGFRIKVGVNEEIDLLSEMGNAVELNEDGYLRITFARVVELYRRMCGVDLYEYGIEDVQITYE